MSVSIAFVVRSTRRVAVLVRCSENDCNLAVFLLVQVVKCFSVFCSFAVLLRLTFLASECCIDLIVEIRRG